MFHSVYPAVVTWAVQTVSVHIYVVMPPDVLATSGKAVCLLNSSLTHLYILLS